jgi:hypothetical protein
MRRLPTVAAILAALLLAAAATFLWWTASPADDEAALAGALSSAPAADGRVAVAQPGRAARWVLRHPQALGLLIVAAPATRAAEPRLRPLLQPLLDGAQGPLVVWWRGRDLGLGARVRPGTSRALTLLAARAGLGCDSDGEFFRVATDASLLATPRPVTAAAAGDARLAALAEVGERLWRVTAGRNRLTSTAGTAVELDAAYPGMSQLESRDASRLLGSLDLSGGGVPVAVRAAFAAKHGWGLAVSGARLPGFIRDALGGASGVAQRWNGFLGDVWVRGGDDRLLIATSEALLARVEPPPAGEQAYVSARDLIWLANDVATSLERLPLLDREARSLRALAVQVEGLETVRWRATEAGTRVELEW